MLVVLLGQVGDILSLQTYSRLTEWGSRCFISKCLPIFPEACPRRQHDAYCDFRQSPTVPSSGNARLDQGRLDRLVRSLFIEGLAPSTIKAYACGQRRYLKFCSLAGLVAVPAREEVLGKFVAKWLVRGYGIEPLNHTWREFVTYI